jgi:uncharacterized protein YndB with AHSA1/START domain
MTHSNELLPDPKLDLVLERIVDVPVELVWLAWTKPEHVKKWFTPAPWSTVDCEIDLRPGDVFRTVMRSPEGQEFPNAGCYLEIIENEKLVWTSALLPGYRPKNIETPSDGSEYRALLFTAIISLAPHGTGTKYTAIVLHQNERECQRHEAMGFHQGWGKALDQLVAHAKTM